MDEATRAAGEADRKWMANREAARNFKPDNSMEGKASEKDVRLGKGLLARLMIMVPTLGGTGALIGGVIGATLGHPLEGAGIGAAIGGSLGALKEFADTWKYWGKD